MHTALIDWTVFDQYPEQTCMCVCGHTFRTHAKINMKLDPPVLVSRKPCPRCDSNTLKAARSDPETFTL